MVKSNDELRGGEVVCGLLEREETPPSMQALGSEMIESETVGSGTEKTSSLDE